VLYVFVCHSYEMCHQPPFGRFIFGVGRFGVILFFVHTSLVLMQSMESLQKRPKKWVLRFYIRRVFRIYPLAMLTILLAVACSVPQAPWEGPNRIQGVVPVVANLLLMQNLIMAEPVIMPLWSLPIEIQMYVILPVVFLALKRRRWLTPMIGMWVLSAIAGIAVYTLTHKLNFFAFTGCFLSGSLAYKLRQTVAPKWTSGLWLLAMLAASVIGACFTLIIPVEWLVCLALALLFPRCEDAKSSLFTQTCHLIAKYSYGIYLSHLFALWIAFRLIHARPIAQILAASIITAVASVVSFYLLEDPLIRLGKRAANLLSAYDLTVRTASC
jgi:peptidoglycan/LPS O-acetylase OafA/YrhL